jgi:hypothetical protein
MNKYIYLNYYILQTSFEITVLRTKKNWIHLRHQILTVLLKSADYLPFDVLTITDHRVDESVNLLMTVEILRRLEASWMRMDEPLDGTF